MKKIIIALLSLMFCVQMFAQSEVKVAAQNATNKLVTLYQLSPDQTAEMLKIQERRFQQIESLQGMKTSQPDLYLKKRESVEKGVLSSTQRVLNDEQEVILKEQLVQTRTKKAALKKKMYSEGASSMAIQEALLEVE